MTRRETISTFETAQADLAAAGELLDRFYAAVSQYEGGMSTADPTGERVSGGGGGGSPVERQAGSRDPARDARKRAEHDIAQIAATAQVLRRRIEYWLSTAETKGVKGGDRGCAVCATVGVFEPGVATRAQNNLAAVLVLCRRHRDFVVRVGRLPTKREASAQATGRRPRVGKVA